eukprot:1157264-Pelagomonas_calceolata.AAC.1
MQGTFFSAFPTPCLLPGESVPVRKVPYDPDLEGPYSAGSSSHCTIFNGTSVVAARGGRGGKPALAMVSATGFRRAFFASCRLQVKRRWFLACISRLVVEAVCCGAVLG